MGLLINLVCLLLSFIFVPAVPAQQGGLPPRLLSIAKQVIKLPKSQIGFPGNIYTYQWQTDQRVFVWQVGIGGSDPQNIKARLIDVRSGAQDDLKAFNARLVQMRPPLGRKIYAFTMRLSPNGKWVIWMGSYARWGAVSLDGTHAAYSDNGPGLGGGGIPKLVWMPDSRHFAALTDYDGEALHIYSLDAPSRQREIKLPPYPSEWIPIVNFFVGLVGFPADDRALVYHPGYDQEGIPLTYFYTFPLDGRTGAIQHYQIPIPKGVQKSVVYSLELSPQGDRLAWCYSSLRYFKNGYSNRQEVWVSDVDGSHMHEIGYHEMSQINGQSATPDILMNLQWLPDGKRLSFLYNDAIWIVPVD